MTVQSIRRAFSVDEYQRMGEVGILTEDDRVELIEGEIVRMTPVGSRHAACVARLTRLLAATVGDRAILWVQNPIRLGDLSEPEPDLALLRPRDDFYASGHPDPAAVLLVIEIGDSSRSFDAEIKAPLYARHGVPELWLIDLGAATIAVHREPSPDGYRTVETRSGGDALSPRAFPVVRLTVPAILGERA
ncbi:MAG: Uma2 family endonuclease [Acidobacteriota bacterium]|jgi:Uma2 family endonuclease